MPAGDSPPDALPVGWQATRKVVAPAPAPLAGVSARGVLELRSELEHMRHGGWAPPKRRRVKGDTLAGTKNVGVEARAARDAAAAAEVATTHSLERKAALYDALAEGRVASGPEGLVDFSGRARAGGVRPPPPPPLTGAATPGLGYDGHDLRRAARVAAAAYDAADTAAARAAAADARAAAEAAAAARRAALRRRFVKAKVEELAASGADPETAP